MITIVGDLIQDGIPSPENPVEIENPLYIIVKDKFRNKTKYPFNPTHFEDLYLDEGDTLEKDSNGNWWLKRFGYKKIELNIPKEEMRKFDDTYFMLGTPKEKTADELFEELGYTKLENTKNGIVCIYVSSWCDVIFYTDETFKVLSSQNTDAEIDMDLLQAINKKVEELRMEIDDVVQFNENHKWIGCLGIITEIKDCKDNGIRYMVGVPVPQGRNSLYICNEYRKCNRKNRESKINC